MQAVAIEASPDILKQICDALDSNEMEFSEPVPTRSQSDALDSPIGADDIKTVLEVITVLFSTGTAVVTFTDRLVTVIRKNRGAQVKLKDPMSGKNLGAVNESTDPHDLQRRLEADG